MVYWRDGHAQVWLTSSQKVPGVDFLPSSIFYGEVEHDGAELLELPQGFEGRFWKAGALVSSRFWTLAPSPEEWMIFLRGAGQVSEYTAPAPAIVAQNDAPWEGLDRLFDPARWFGEKQLVGSMMLLLGSVLLWQLMQMFLWQNEIEATDIAQVVVSNDIEEVLSKRAQVRSDQAHIDLYNQLREGVGTLSLLTMVAETLDEPDVILQEFRHENGQLQLRISGASKDLTEYVRDFELHMEVNDVTATKGVRKGELLLGMNVSRSLEQTEIKSSDE